MLAFMTFGYSRRLILLSLPLLAFLYLVGDTFIEDDNFRVVDESLYRSGQLRPDEWSESYAEHPYSSVLNLRGANQGTSWYGDELTFATEHRLHHYDYAISAKVPPTNTQMEEIVSIMRAAPKPLLIHCNSGSDRSGLVSALYVYSIEDAGPEQAAKQLSMWYGHFPWFRKTAAMDDALASFVANHPAGLTLTSDAPHHLGRRWPT